ncbi:MAG: hypothetical protein ACO1QR_11920 [Chthoniobacteraceae bacterium]
MTPEPDRAEQMTELLIKQDGTIYVHNLTPEMALVLSTLNPDDPRFRARLPEPAPTADARAIAS